MVTSLVDTVKLLSRLDTAGIEVWPSRGRWFWAKREHLKMTAPRMSSDTPNTSAVNGPFFSALDAARSAYRQICSCKEVA